MTATADPAGLRVTGLGVRFGRAVILDGVEVAVPPGSWTAVVGPNGAGKSTLLRAIAALVPHTGSVLLDGVDVAALPPRARAVRIGYAPQIPTVPEGISVGDYVMLGRTPHRGLLAGASHADGVAVAAALDRLELDSLARRPMRTLSGGERQRAVLARALAQQPRLLLLDEPTAALDLGHAQQVLELVDELRLGAGLAVVSTLHDLVLAGQYADQLVLLAAGQVVAAGPAEQVLTEAALARYYGASARVELGPDGVHVHPVRRRPAGAGVLRSRPAP